MSLVLVSQQHDRSLLRRLEQPERQGILRELDGDDAPARLAPTPNPALFAGVDPVDAWPSPRAERVTDGERLAVVRRVRKGDACPDRVTGAKKSAEVGLIGDPQRRDEQVIPTAVPRVPSAVAKVLSATLGGAQRAEATSLS